MARVLFNGNVPRQLRRLLPDHEIDTTQELGWDRHVPDHVVLWRADDVGYDAVVTADREWDVMDEEHRDSSVLATWERARRAGIVFLDPGRGGRVTRRTVLPRAAEVDRAIRGIHPRGFTRIDLRGREREPTAPSTIERPGSE